MLPEPDRAEEALRGWEMKFGQEYPWSGEEKVVRLLLLERTKGFTRDQENGSYWIW